MVSRHVGFSSCGTWASLLRGMWDLPGPGIKPVSPALAGRFLTIVPPGKSLEMCLLSLVHAGRHEESNLGSSCSPKKKGELVDSNLFMSTRD